MGLLAAVCAANTVPFSLQAAPPTTVENARQADSFVDSIGVNIHVTFTDTAYGNYSGIVRPMLLNLGVRHVRDGFNSIYQPYLNYFNDLAGQGIRANMLVPPGVAVSLANTIPAALESVEGPNESDYSGFSYTRNGTVEYFPAATRDEQTDLFNAIKGNAPTASLPVIATSFAHNGAAAVGAEACDFSNVHSYPSAQTPDTNLDSNFGNPAAIVGGSKPVVATETGYYTLPDGSQGVSEAAHGKYMPRLFLEYFRRGVVRTYSYELLDESSNKTTSAVYDNGNNPECHFGLVKVTGTGPNPTAVTPKAAYTALQNLIALLKDPGASFQPGSLDYSVVGANPALIHHVLLQKRDGSFWLALWQNGKDYDPAAKTDLSPAAQNVTVTFGQSVGTVDFYLPNKSQSPAYSPLTGPASFTVAVDDTVLLVRIGGVAVSTKTALYAGLAMSGAAEGEVFASSPYSGGTTLTADYTSNPVGDGTSNQADRAVVKFDLPALRAGQSVSAASLGFYLHSVYGAPTTGVDLVAYDSPQGGLRIDDWNAAGNASTVATVFNTSSTVGAYTVNNAALLQAVQHAYATGNGYVALRFQLSGGALTTGTSNAADFYSVGTSKITTTAQWPSLQLTLQTATQTYAQWTSQFFTSAQQADPVVSGPGAAPQGDGVSNLLKYAFDIDPTRLMTAADRAALPAAGQTARNGVPYLTLTYRRFARLGGATIAAQTSPDLIAWTTVTDPTATVQVGSDPVTGDPLMQVQVPFPGGREFIRLNVSLP